MDNKRLVEFLYLIMRDHLPTGVVAQTIQEVTDNEVATQNTVNVYTNEHLEALAKDYAGRIVGD